MATNFYIELGGGGGGSSTSLTIGNIDSQGAVANALQVLNSVLYAQSADSTHPGMVNNTTQTFSGAKTISGSLAIVETADVVGCSVKQFTGASSALFQGKASDNSIVFFVDGAGGITGINATITGLTASRALTTNGSKLLASSATTSTELGYVSGVTSAIQTQLNALQATVTIGALDAQAENANGLALVSNVLSAQSADATHPGMVNITTQTFAGAKTLSSTAVLSAGYTATGASTLTGNANSVLMTVKANATQTANIQDWIKSDNTILVSVLGTGQVFSTMGGTQASPAFQVSISGNIAGMWANVTSGLSFAYNNTECMFMTGSSITSAISHKFSAGSAGTPGIYFGSDNNTGLYRSASNEISLSNSSAQKMIWNSSLITMIPAVKIGADSTTPQHTINTTVKTNGASVGTLSNAPSAGNPTGFIQITVNGTTSYVPYWQ